MTGESRTWDGHLVSPEPPHGAMIVVYRMGAAAIEFLVLHRQHHGREYAGDWAWGPPSGARYPGEPVEVCARRELWEEAGLRLPLRAVTAPAVSWMVFLAESPAGCEVNLSPEHDRCAWLPLADAAALVAPESVRQAMQAAAAQV